MQQLGGDENMYEKGEVPAAVEPKHEDIIYGQIVANNQPLDIIPSSNMKNDNNAVIYSDLEGVGIDNRANDL